MKAIKKLVKQIDEELEGAKEYTEKALELMSVGETTWASKYKELAQDELRHADVIHEYAVQEIEKLRNVYTPPVEMQEKWEYEHKKYVEDAAWIKTMLQM